MPAVTTSRSRTVVAVLAAIGSVVALDASAQVPQPAYPPPANYPPPPGGSPQDYASQQPGAAPRPNPLRSLFAGTLSAIIQGVSGGLVTTVTQGVTGSVATWFDRRQRDAMGTPQYVYGTQQPAPTYPGATNTQGYPAPQPTYGTQTPTYGSQAPTYGTQAPTYGAQQPTPDPYGATNPYPTTPPNPYPTANPYPVDPNAPTSPGYTPNSSASYPYGTTSQPSPNVYGSPPAYDWSSTQVYDPRTGQVTSAQGSGYAVASPPPDATQIVAGGAYDVHAVGAAGNESYVNAATYEFRTGDRFKVYFRPTLPGRLEVYNVNPSGRETRIDSVEIAAGQLTTLGPYQFAATKGDEQLRFVIAPCMTQQLLVATRDIVNVYSNAQPGYGAPASTSGGLPLSACGAPTTRSVDAVKTRDIQKVGVDGTTSFALDPVSQAELASGQLAPRQFTVWFHHR